jgi:hypothetical protein
MLFPALVLSLAAAIAQNSGAPPQSPQNPPAPATQTPSTAAPSASPELPVLNARLGACAADFLVKDADGKPVYLALIHVNVRYGTMNLKRMDLEVGTNSEGKAKISGLPDKAKPMTYDITKEDKKTVVDQDVAKSCQAKLEVTLK